MRKEVIGSNQLFALIILFEMGTALVVPIGLESGNAVWLSILMALPGGLLLYLIYHDLYLQYPNMIISGYTQKILGKFIGWPLSLLYIPNLMFNGSRNLREVGDLLIVSSYDSTPLFILNATMIVAVIYILNKGIEVIARTAEIYLLIVIMMGLICSFLVITAGLVDLKNLFPLHAKEWKDALKSAYPNIWIFPFGELVCLTTILPHFNKTQNSKKTGIIAIGLSGVLLSFTHAIEIAVLGEDLYSKATFSLYSTVSLVSLVNFIQRLDAFVIVALIIGVFFKLTIYCYAAMVITADLFNVQEPRKLALPISVVVLFSSFIGTENQAAHLEEGKIYLKYVLIILCAVIPILLFIIHRIRKRFDLYK